ncbi:Rieske 2Fe-2S domain-containing protein [Dysgonomonas sp. HDW5A]|uniref:Rieske (2Fe-2S) protein n=1 Tax=unclassified Dysgonomonas TaxID=2630389 RepID=UPI001407A008|nr:MULTISPECIES: Rieske 2Fe-2S domain-containing protein [unclassified Dysgonomonas]QIK54287.1 Rieske 2Fe-2S domain-containing protein [Dysgonomonas sp. HDW5B]QIK59690.1 Rieske 2Fe-2S domain-containing protein [Dysgonomonas sp. HDW5A]
MIRAFQYIFIITVISLLSACAKEESQNSTVPTKLVEININITLEHQFQNPFYSKKYYNNTGTVKYAGYGGVLAISNAEASWIYAYDLCCPHEAPLINEIEVISSLQAQCPKCKSIYQIADGTGRVTSGPSTERLRSYRVMKDGSFFRIRN